MLYTFPFVALPVYLDTFAVDVQMCYGNTIWEHQKYTVNCEVHASLCVWVFYFDIGVFACVSCGCVCVGGARWCGWMCEGVLVSIFVCLRVVVWADYTPNKGII